MGLGTTPVSRSLKKEMRFESFRAVALAAVCVLAAAAPGWAQAKIGVVDFQQALLATADMQKEASKLEQKFKPDQDRLEALIQRAAGDPG